MQLTFQDKFLTKEESSEGDEALEQAAQGERGVSGLGDIQTLAGKSPELPAVTSELDLTSKDLVTRRNHSQGQIIQEDVVPIMCAHRSEPAVHVQVQIFTETY